jgi:hypothetical protein
VDLLVQDCAELGWDSFSWFQSLSKVLCHRVASGKTRLGVCTEFLISPIFLVFLWVARSGFVGYAEPDHKVSKILPHSDVESLIFYGVGGGS